MLIMKSLSFGLTGLILFAVVHLLCDFGWLAFVSVLVHRTKSLWGGRVQQGLLIASSLLLIGFGGWFLSSGFQVTV
jgi:threonine/homoserine/homoserine lactone efflux protein